MGDVIRISACVILAVLASTLIKNEKPAYGFFIGLAMGIFVLALCMKRIAGITQTLARLKDYLGAGSDQLGILLKVLGITYVCEFAAGICRDAGYGFLAGQMETLGKLCVTLSGLAILVALIDQILLLG